WASGDDAGGGAGARGAPHRRQHPGGGAAMQARARALRGETDLAWLELSDTAGGCGRCDEPGGCRSVQVSHVFGGPDKVFALPMSFPVKPGDKVVISIPDGAPLSAALAAYGLATLLLLAGAAIGSVVGGDGRADLF